MSSPSAASRAADAAVRRRIQDTIPIHAAIVSQRLAIAALKRGSSWVQEQVEALGSNRSGCAWMVCKRVRQLAAAAGP